MAARKNRKMEGSAGGAEDKRLEEVVAHEDTKAQSTETAKAEQAHRLEVAAIVRRVGCPFCGTSNVEMKKAAAEATLRHFRCRECNRGFSAQLPKPRAV